VRLEKTAQRNEMDKDCSTNGVGAKYWWESWMDNDH
jgi:hypothetical protein